MSEVSCLTLGGYRVAGKMSPKFVVLCSLAVGAIYTSGYSITANGSTAPSAPPPQQSQAAPANNSAASGSNSSSAAKPTKPAQQYLDGNYTGSASNRIGMVSVAVTISQGKIANVQITACDTHYPEGYIDPVLPDYVVSHQTTNIPVVSGATLSTEDFYYGVVQALSQAQNPNYKG